MKRKRFMSAYYYGFNETGCDEIDDILEALCWAGKAYHNTSEWREESDIEGKSYIDLIQQAAIRAAEKIKKLEEGK